MMRLSEAAAVLGTTLRGPDVEFSGVSTDSRTLRAGSLFVALRGPNHDGHRFLDMAAAASAAGALVESAGVIGGGAALPLVPVSDTRIALGLLAAHWRGRFGVPVVALTGSSGKTTVKEMLGCILREAVASTDAAAAVLVTRGNLNNDIGVPLMLLELTPAHRFAVIEMGMNHAGEIRYLSNLARPDVALVNNAGSAHIEFLGSAEAIARAKGEIFEGLKPEGTAVINGDDVFAGLWRGLAGDRRCIDFGIGADHTVSARYLNRFMKSEIVLRTSRGEVAASLQVPGLHNVRNAAAAGAAACALDVPLSAIGAGLSAFRGVAGRMQRRLVRQGAMLIDDTYNANPESVRAAIDVLAGAPGARVLILGDMGELGPDAPRLHEETGAYAREAGVDTLLTLGRHAEQAALAFGAGAKHCDDIEDLLKELEPHLKPSATVLVKGSRFMQMERVVARLDSSGPRGGQ